MIDVFGIEIVLLHLERLWLIVPVALVTFALFAWNFYSGVKALAKSPFLRLHVDEVRPRWRRYLTDAFAFFLLFALLIVVVAEPERRTHTVQPVFGGVRIAFLLDVSLSMKYSHDVAPYPDRLAAAKSILEDFAAMTQRDPDLYGEYWRAIIPFAGVAMSYLPFTAGYEEFIEAVDSIDEMTINNPGTDLLQPIEEYELMLKEYPKKTESTVDILVLISDGGQGEGTRKDLPYIKAALLRMKNTIPFAVGIGSVEITKLQDGTELRKTLKVPLVIQDQGGRVVGYALEDPRDPKSERLYSELDEQVLMQIASPERYILYTGREVFLAKLKQMMVEHRKLVDTISLTRSESVAWWFLIPAIFLACLMFGYVRRLFSLLFFAVTFFPSKLINRFSR